jgi:hypothetical protein
MVVIYNHNLQNFLKPVKTTCKCLLTLGSLRLRNSGTFIGVPDGALTKLQNTLAYYGGTSVTVGSTITNGREPKSCLGRVFNFKLGSFIDNTKIAQPANGHF